MLLSLWLCLLDLPGYSDKDVTGTEKRWVNPDSYSLGHDY